MLFWTFFFWVVYIAFEPFVRRRWPGRIISWSRLLAGGFRDPLVGHDILIGALFGLGMILSNFYLANLVPQWLGYPPSVPLVGFSGDTTFGTSIVCAWHYHPDLCFDFSIIYTSLLSTAALYPSA